MLQDRGLYRLREVGVYCGDGVSTGGRKFVIIFSRSRTFWWIATHLLHTAQNDCDSSVCTVNQHKSHRLVNFVRAKVITWRASCSAYSDVTHHHHHHQNNLLWRHSTGAQQRLTNSTVQYILRCTFLQRAAMLALQALY